MMGSRMTACEGRDESLLMLAHGALERGAALRTRAHLLACPRCRARFRRMEGLTASIASALSNPRLGARKFGSPSRASWASVGLLAVLLTILSGIVATEVAPTAASAVPMAGADCHRCHSGTAGGTKTAKSKDDDLLRFVSEKPNLSAPRCDR